MVDFSDNRIVRISPSLLSADFMNLQRDVELIETGSPDWLHVDVMDGHFVPNLTIGPPVIKALKKITDVPLDVHLMVDNPLDQLEWYLESEADLLTVQIECAGKVSELPKVQGSSISVSELDSPEYIDTLILRTKAANRKIGLAINPDTPARLVLPYLDRIDLVLVMSVHPGFGGQNFMDSALDKIKLISLEATKQRLDLLIEVDGGINAQTARQAVDAGANMLVAGNAIFGDADPVAALARIRASLSSVN